MGSVVKSGGVVDTSVHVTHSVNQSIPDAVFTTVAFDTERFDTDSMHDVSVNNSRITINTPGKYRFWAMLTWLANTAGRRHILIRKNGTLNIADLPQPPNTVTNGNTGQELSSIDDAVVGDFYELRAFQNSGGALNMLKLAEASPEFAAYRFDVPRRG